jgi:hypothetical protein
MATASADLGRDGDDRVSPAAKLCGFLLLLAAVFIGAYAAGAYAGPVTIGSTSPGTSSPGPASPGMSGSMNMSGP